MMNRAIALILLAFSATFALQAQKNVVDQVIWVVGGEPILLSDVEEARITSELRGIPVENPYCVIPEQLAIQKLFLHQAELDSVEVSEADIITEANEIINNYIQQYGSVEAVESVMGRKLSQMREILKKNRREENMIMEVQRAMARDVKVTPAEVREFFKSVPTDSLPFVPTQVEVQILTSTPKVSRSEVERIEATLREYARRVNDGETSFSVLARLYSQDGSARNGGELGLSGRNEWVPEFANVAFSLNDPTKASKIVRTEFGYHILQLIEKRGDRVNVRHILLKPEIEQSELERCTGRLDSIANDIRNGLFSFDVAAQELSDDKDTRLNHGLMVNSDMQTRTVTSRFEMKDLPPEVARVVDTLQVDQVSQAFTMIGRNGSPVCAIVRLKNRIEGHHASMTEDFQKLRDVVLEKRRSEKVEKWIKEKIKNTYVRINPDWRNCEFEYEGWIK